MKYRHVLLFVMSLWAGSAASGQTWEWVRSEGGDRAGYAIRANAGTGICTDKSGNIYVSGYFSGKAVFGSDTLNSYGDIHPVLIKYDRSGKVEWAKRMSRGATDFAHAVCVDPGGNPCVTGIRSGQVISAVTAKYDGKGKLLWISEAEGENCDSRSRAIASDENGNTYVAGDCKGVIKFDDFTIGATEKYTMFLVKYDQGGRVVWVRHSQPAPNYYNQALCLALDKENNVYVSGEYFKSAKFDNLSVSGQGDADVFLIKYDPKGKAQWIKSWGSSGKDRPGSIAVDKAGNIFLTAYFSAPATVKDNKLSGENLMKLTPNGDFVWNTLVGSASKDYMINAFVALDNKGFLYLTGNIYGARYLFDENVALGKGASDIFVAKCSFEGKKIWVTRMGSFGVDEGSAICLDNDSNIYVTGIFHGEVAFGNVKIKAKSNDDGIFVGKLK